jgi:hypothetical protein
MLEEGDVVNQGLHEALSDIKTGYGPLRAVTGTAGEGSMTAGISATGAIRGVITGP